MTTPLPPQRGIATLEFGGRVLRFRTNPSSVWWSYRLITHVENTYGGRVVQILGARTEDLTVTVECGKGGWNYLRQIVGFMRDNLGPTMITLHQVHHPELSVDGDTATGTWGLQDRVIMTEHRLLLDGASYYDDDYRRGADGTWRIARTSYRRLYEHMISMDDVPSFQLTATPWAER